MPGARSTLPGVRLAVVALTPIAVHEVIAALAPAARQLPALATSARRVVEVLDRPDPVPDAGSPATVPEGPLGVRARGLTLRYRDATRDALAGLAPDVPAGARALLAESGFSSSMSPPSTSTSRQPARSSVISSLRPGTGRCSS